MEEEEEEEIRTRVFAEFRSRKTEATKNKIRIVEKEKTRTLVQLCVLMRVHALQIHIFLVHSFHGRFLFSRRTTFLSLSLSLSCNERREYYCVFFSLAFVSLSLSQNSRASIFECIRRGAKNERREGEKEREIFLSEKG